MNHLDIFSKKRINQLTNFDEDTLLIGQTIDSVNEKENWKEELTNSLARFVIVGFPEDIGTRVNNIHLSTQNSFYSCVRELLNFQDNLYLNGDNCFLLGSMNFEDLATKLNILTVNRDDMHHLVEEVDRRVQNLMDTIFEAGKIPIVIGGGQNNSYPILKSLNRVSEKPVNCFNVAAHTSLKPPEGRTARNGFSYALAEDILQKYYVFGLHESEIPHSIFEFILANHEKIGFTRFEAILKNDPYLFEALDEAKEFLEGYPTGLEINMNCISDLILSPNFPDGFLLREVRQLIRKFANEDETKYLYLCEASSSLNNEVNDRITGKSLALLVTDFIKTTTYNEEE